MRADASRIQTVADSLLVTNHSIVTCQGNTMDTGQAPPTKFINFAGPGAGMTIRSVRHRRAQLLLSKIDDTPVPRTTPPRNHPQNLAILWGPMEGNLERNSKRIHFITKSLFHYITNKNAPSARFFITFQFCLLRFLF